MKSKTLLIIVVTIGFAAVIYLMTRNRNEQFNGAFDPSVRYSVSNIGPIYSPYNDKQNEENCGSCA